MATAKYQSYRDGSYLSESPFKRIAKLLNLRGKDVDSLTLSRKVHEGLKLETVHISKDFEKARTYKLVSDSTIARGKPILTKDASEKVYDRARLHDQALAVFSGDVEAVDRFLVRPHPMLDGKKPIEVSMESSLGTDIVVDLLKRSEAGLSV